MCFKFYIKSYIMDDSFHKPSPYGYSIIYMLSNQN